MKTTKLFLIGIVLLKMNGVSAQDNHFPNHLTTYNYFNSSLPDDCVLKMQKDSKGNLWVLTNNGLNVNNGAGWSTAGNFMDQNRFKDFIIDKSDMMWLISSKGTEIVSYDLHNQWSTVVNTTGNMLLFFSGEIASNKVYVMSTKGYVYFDTEFSKDRQEVVPVVQSSSVLYKTTETMRINLRAGDLELQQDKTHALPDNDKLFYSRGYEDRNGTIWMGTYFNGVFAVSANKAAQYTMFHNPVWAFTEDASGNLLVGTWGEGIFLKEPQGTAFLKLELPGLNTTDLHINTLLVDAQNVMWIGTAEQGIIKVDHLDELVKEKTGSKPAENKIPASSINITLYPNPAKESVFVRYQSDNDKNLQVKMYNMLGCEVLDLVNHRVKAKEGSTEEVSISHLPAGVYFMVFTDARQSYTQKITISK